MPEEIKEFSWDGESVVVKRTDAVAIYLNHDGDLVIRQQVGFGDEDQSIVINVEDIERVALAIQSLLDGK